MRTHLRKHRRRGAEGDTCWEHSWSFSLGKECSVTEEGGSEGTVAMGGPCQSRDTPEGVQSWVSSG